MKTYKGKVTEVKKEKDGKIKIIITCEPKITKDSKIDKIENVKVRLHTENEELLGSIGSEVNVNINNNRVHLLIDLEKETEE